MYLLHRIGPRYSSNWNTLEEIMDSKGPLSFDGIYTEVYEYYKRLKGRDVTFFVMGKYVGGDNSFDKGERPGHYCTWPMILEMAEYLGAKIGYHGWSHQRCVGLASIDVFEEIQPPAILQIDDFAWPHGVCDATAIEVARGFYEKAYCAGPYGDGSPFQMKREYLNW